MNIVKVTEKEVNEVCRLAHEIWPVHYIPIIGEDQVNYMLKNRYSKEELSHQIKTRKADYYLLKEQTENVGYASISKLNEGDYFLDKLYILDQKQKKGLGYVALVEIINQYPDLKTLRLQVNRLNFKAINFYFKFGFVIESTGDFDIGNGFYMNDFVMLFQLKGMAKR